MGPKVPRIGGAARAGRAPHIGGASPLRPCALKGHKVPRGPVWRHLARGERVLLVGLNLGALDLRGEIHVRISVSGAEGRALGKTKGLLIGGDLRRE
eukprot:14950479-Alexandrium_andersonii.AAC.1